MENFVATVALTGIVIIVASLASGLIERSGVPLAAAFLLLGTALGPAGFGLIDVQLDSPELRVLGTLGLALVLFTDAVTVDTREIRERRRLVAVVVGPGTILPAALIAVAGVFLLDLPFAAAAILGAALASTDPVLLRTVLRAPSMPPTTRVALRLEGGMNDAVLLPVVVLATLWLGTQAPQRAEDWARPLVGLFLLGPALGALIGWLGITMLAAVRDRIGVRRDYESLYALGLGFAAFAAAEGVGGSGFLAAFAAGLAIASLDVELCDCFLEYGQATAEMLLLLAFVAFGASLIWTGFGDVDAWAIAFAAVAIVARTIILFPVLTQIGVRGLDRSLIALFGPRGLSSLLLVLLPVFAGVPGAERLFRVTCLVVVLSLVVHGTIIGVFLRRAGSPDPVAAADETITLDEVRALRDTGAPVIVVDARASRSHADDARQAVGAVRLPPDDPVRAAREQQLARHATLVVYCA
ncbi:MAG: cation:proton antiporter [Gemmatimonadaceae bacterium]